MWSFSLILVLLGAVGISSYERGCPDYNDSDLCKCNDNFGEINVHCSAYRQTKERITSSLQKLKKRKIDELWLSVARSDVSLSTLFQDIDTEIKRLVFSNNEMGSFSEERPFQGLENSLEELMIHHSTIEKTIKLGHLQRLKKFKLFQVTIPEINGDLFEEGIPSLRDVIVWYNTPRKIRNDAFGKLTKLKTLEIRGQTLEKLERSLLPNPAPALEGLTLRNSEISDIAEDFFTNLPALDMLDLDDNEISTIDQTVFKPIWKQLGIVTLRENPIVCDSRLNWLLPLSGKPKLYAKCQSPEELRGKKVGHLPEGKTEYDP